jgi:hypothetical protein
MDKSNFTDLFKDAVLRIIESADEVMTGEDNEFRAGQALAYMSALTFIKDAFEDVPNEIKTLGLDFDIEKKYISAVA